MRLEYDLNVGALYISLSDHEVARTRVVNDNTSVDLDAAGELVGIEVIAIGSPWPVDAVLRDYRMPASQMQQFRTYFRPSLPGVLPDAGPVTRHEAPEFSVVPGGMVIAA